MKKILVIGDSISMGYTPHLAAAVAGRATATHPPENCGHSRFVRERIETWVGAGGWDVITVNAGLHDIRRSRPNGTLQVPLAEYRDNMENVLSFVTNQARNVIWVTTTPVLEERQRVAQSFDRLNSDIHAYNAAARAIAEALSLPVCDLHGWVLAQGAAETLRQDGVHLTDEGYAGAAGYLVAAIEKYI